jgi:hypothetical protein
MRLRFTIRDLLWLTLVVALALGWWVDRRSYSVPPRFQLSDVTTTSGTRTYPTDNQTGERWIKVNGSAPQWYPVSIKIPTATKAAGK